MNLGPYIHSTPIMVVFQMCSHHVPFACRATFSPSRNATDFSGAGLHRIRTASAMGVFVTSYRLSEENQNQLYRMEYGMNESI